MAAQWALLKTLWHNYFRLPWKQFKHKTVKQLWLFVKHYYNLHKVQQAVLLLVQKVLHPKKHLQKSLHLLVMAQS
jgi:hypothetical protein